MLLSCPDYTWPLLPHAAVLDLVRALDLDGVDVGFMAGRSHVRPEAVASEGAEHGASLRAELDKRGLRAADVFAIPATDFESMSVTNPSSAEQERSVDFFSSAVRFAAALGAPGITTLPGTRFPGDTFEDALSRAVPALSRRVDLAAAAGLAVSVEPHVGSLIEEPESTHTLLDRVPGLTLTLDHAHFVYSGVPQAEIDELLPSARHLQCRPAAPGQLQLPVAEDTIDFDGVVHDLARLGYRGFLAVEFVWQEWMGCNRVDTVAETALMRDRLRLAQHQTSPVAVFR